MSRDEELIEAARNAATRAYAPFSDYRVGAALLTASGEIVTGCNVENSSYGLSICAERAAVFAARLAGLADPKGAPVVAVAIHASRPPVAWPCGACRQVLHEFAGDDLRVLVDGPDGVEEMRLAELLPRAFRLEGR